jgi:hypothetical protein
MTNSGRGAEWLEQRYFPVRKKFDTSWIARRGFDPEPATEWSEAAKAEYKRQIEVFQQVPHDTQMRSGLLAAAQGIEREVEEAGLRPMFLVPPTVRAEEHFDPAPLALSPVFVFDDPVRFPRLYLPELHYDPGHLNETGAREFSDLLAEQLTHEVMTGL